MSYILDPRVKLYLLILGAVYISLQLSFPLELLLIFIYTAPFFLAGLFQWGIIFLLIYLIQIFISIYIVPKINLAFIIFIISFLVFVLRYLLPSIIAGAYSMKMTSVSDCIIAFNNVRLSNCLWIHLD